MSPIPSRHRRRHFEGPILQGREPSATDSQKAKGEDASSELSTIVNTFILRRTNTLLSQHLPPKTLQVRALKRALGQGDSPCLAHQPSIA